MTYDLVIIGAGPAGLTAGIYARSRKMKTLIIDAASIGGQLTNLYPEKAIHNYPGFVLIQAKKLAEKLQAQAESMGCEIQENERVTHIDDGDRMLIVTTDKGRHQTRSVIVAIGMGLFKPRRMNCVGEEELRQRGVHYILPHKELLVGKKVVMLGGGNSALEMALIADSVTETTVVHRRDSFRADESVVEAVDRSNIHRVLNAEVKSINGGSRVESVTVEVDGEEQVIPADIVVINIGITSDMEDLKNWRLNLDHENLIRVDNSMATNRPGIFACGDVINYDGKYRQIVTACGEAATACNSAYKFVKRPYWA
ncbi:MAG: NAD(P)/FAD-dependent oxidoreductase [Candidatus Methanomethylophilaceae archaeon]|jgi:thioredoxin reductase (NADPH)